MTRFARRYSAHPWASPLRGQRRRCSKTLPAFLSGQPAYCVRGLSNWRCQLSNPGRGFSSPPGGCHMRKKKPVLAYELFLKYGGEGGIDSLRSPLRGSPLAGSRSVQLAAPVVEPRSGVLIPPAGATCEKKARTCVQALISNMAVRGGLTRFARPCGAARSQARSLSNWLRQLSNPGRGFSSPPAENIKEKSLYLRTGSHLEYGGEGGIRTPDTLPYTHFPGVLLQPLGHLTILSCCSPWVGNGALL